MQLNHGLFVISIDFELYWGLRDLMRPDRYKQEMLGERELIPRVLELFRQQGIHATWATVGLLFLRRKEEIRQFLPPRLPAYNDLRLSPYPALLSSGEIGGDEARDPMHFASSLIRMIADTPYQRIGTHTFSHYYCKEEGQEAADFTADLEAAVQVARREGLTLESIVFPRNQISAEYVRELGKSGIRSYRGNPDHPLYREGYSHKDRLLKRVLRLLDAYLNLSGYHTYSPAAAVSAGGLASQGWDSSNQPVNEVIRPANVPLNLPASHFFRSYVRGLHLLEPLRLRRIRNAMTYAAKHRQVYHLWWHPYNLADRYGRNFKLLEQIVAHYKHLEQAYGMRSAGMEELCDQLIGREDEEK